MGYYVEVEQGIRLFVQDLNPEGKTTILFIHGWPLSHKQFEYQFDVLPQYGVRCIGLDWRGFGQSDKPYFGYNFDRLADDLRAVIDTMGITNVILLGHSTGGAIATRYMSRHKGYGVSGLVLVDAAVPTGLPPEVANPIIEQTLNDRPNMLNDLTNMFFFQYATRSFQQWFFDLGLEASGWSTAAIMKLLSEADLHADLPAIQVPTLIIHGIHDQVVPFSQAEALHKQLPTSQLVPLLYSGHGGFWEERDRFNRILLEWLGLSTGSSS
ncbi:MULTISPECIES: alpha/beta fold hydrolase [Paenibacillus]|uniref:alpha/beta fold hydrolase n=1 Tax=Paenibacillus TaxID=44249 RepID=UPI00203AFF13|nr:alpha/beta hydrolase [Paenibacillus camelliae]MCM3633308.1 alpha/beta hydrolase [Paenibacillus camelliae]